MIAVVAAALLCTGAALRGTLVYASTPGELSGTHQAAQQKVRLTGTVQAGTERRTDGALEFVLVGGGGSVRVHSRDLPTAAFREGEDAVVEGHLDPDGVFVADRLITKHSNTYEAKDTAAVVGGQGR